jgi:hypothetical protein
MTCWSAVCDWPCAKENGLKEKQINVNEAKSNLTLFIF